jgi:hypothetical protein
MKKAAIVLAALAAISAAIAGLVCFEQFRCGGFDAVH